MEINGLPAHALVIHAAVVFGPLAAMLALAYLAIPSRRDLLRWPMVVVAVGTAGLILVTFITGNMYLDSQPGLEQDPDVQTHTDRAPFALGATLTFGVVAAVTGLLHDRRGAVRLVLTALLAVTALATLVAVVMTGDAGAQAVWGS